jgi:hypothetical protein
MECKYVPVAGRLGTIHRPYLPVTFSFASRRFPVGHALVDTGADGHHDCLERLNLHCKGPARPLHVGQG